MVELLALALVIGIVCAIISVIYTSEKEKEELLRLGAEAKCSANHINGLPLCKGASCNLIVYRNKFVIKTGTSEFEISNDRIEQAEIKTETEIQTIAKTKSSATKTVAGGLLFGPIGAIVGAMPKSKEKKVSVNSFYFILNYFNKNNELSFIVFDVTNDTKRLLVLAELKKHINPTEKKIEL